MNTAPLRPGLPSCWPTWPRHRAGLWRRPLAVAPWHRGHAVGWMAFGALQAGLPRPWRMGLLIAFGTLGGWWACTTTARNLGVADPGAIVWDEVVAFWLVLWLAMPMGFWGQILAFALFRFLTPPSPAPWPGLTACSRLLAGAVAGASCSTTLWRPSARCW